MKKADILKLIGKGQCLDQPPPKPPKPPKPKPKESGK